MRCMRRIGREMLGNYRETSVMFLLNKKLYPSFFLKGNGIQNTDFDVSMIHLSFYCLNKY